MKDGPQTIGQTDTHRALHQLGGGVLPVDGRFQDVPALDGHVGSGQYHPKNFGWDPGVKKNRNDVEMEELEAHPGIKKEKKLTLYATIFN